ncbi:hypothetical protein GCM10010327_41810 [Streptomyces nitrosporeus]|nr:hypothetical protein GCM10010327_41810 [Streptomyces nitrosporeus]
MGPGFATVVTSGREAEAAAGPTAAAFRVTCRVVITRARRRTGPGLRAAGCHAAPGLRAQAMVRWARPG